MSSTRRALHFVLKIASLVENLKFFRDDLGMTVLRHEVFEQGCDAACNGPYDGKWSKTMIGYGAEDNHFVLELTYNYSIGAYILGNDLQYIKIALDGERYDKIKKSTPEVNNEVVLSSPDGYKFKIVKAVERKQDVTEVCLSSTNLKKSTEYWRDLLKMNLVPNDSGTTLPTEVALRYQDEQAILRFKRINETLDHKSAYGRIAFSSPSEELKPIQKIVEDGGYKVLTPYLSLDTPGKATVQVVILADPDGHEICFVGDEGFRELSKVDPKANELIERSIAEDKSNEWYEKKNKSKGEA